LRNKQDSAGGETRRAAGPNSYLSYTSGGGRRCDRDLFPDLHRQRSSSTTVDGQPITELDIQQRAKFHEMATHKTPNRQDIINELSNEIREISQAEHRAIAPSDAEVSEAFAQVASNMAVGVDELTEILTKGGASADTIKQRLRADIASARLKRGGYDLRGTGD
jgi:peptidyl-prolyl cis-trans isomerase SurA